ncbi:GNAT family N-acetyltransferase [Brevibacillus dissolubilis]|uniref:GNAT family N-acetyltransferase n=1 Tax=Brevibacillus dissolubilis TaxID=1844116 RepID=UPI00111756EF|nr:GNAT family N-acetyltransferase [Brevibacillus dissolubilis]
MTYVLETARTRLRQLTTSDTQNLAHIFTDPEAMRYYPSTKDLNETIAWINRMIRGYDEDGIAMWAVEHKETGEFLGQCGLIMQEVDDVRETEVGYLFVRKFWGQGYATEVARACMAYGFGQLQRERIISIIRPENYPSSNVAKRNGMRLDKTTSWKGFTVDIYEISKETFYQHVQVAGKVRQT